MKTLPRSAHSLAGNALLVTIFVTGLIGFVLAAYLTLVRGQNNVNARSQTWNSALPVIEAGVEEALSHLNAHGLSNLECNGWTQASNTYTMTRALGDGYYSVSIGNWVPGSTTNSPVIEARGFVAMPLLTAATPAAMLAAAAVSTYAAPAYLSRGIRVGTRPNFLFTKSVAAHASINLNGFNVSSDSFDSENPLFSTNGLYTSAKARDKGDIASDGSITNTVRRGNLNVAGHVSTGPDGVITLGANGVIGDAAWHAGNNSGIQSGYSSSDMNVSFPDVTPPFNGGAFTPTGGWITNLVDAVSTNTTVATSITYPAGAVVVSSSLVKSTIYPVGSPGPVKTNWSNGGTHVNDYEYPVFTYATFSYTTNQVTASTYYDYILDSGNYELSSLSGSVYVRGSAVLYVTSSLNLSALGIAPEQTLKLYSAAANATVVGTTSRYGNTSAASFQYFGLPGNATITLNGNGAFTGTVYAPGADVTLEGVATGFSTGGGSGIYWISSSPSDFFGALISRSVVLNAAYNFHYDEALGRNGPFRGWVVNSWTEMTPAEVAAVTVAGY